LRVQYSEAPQNAKAYAQEFRAFVLRNEKFNGRLDGPNENQKLAGHLDEFLAAINSAWWSHGDGGREAFTLVHHCKKDGTCCPGSNDAEKKAYMDTREERESRRSDAFSSDSRLWES